LEFSINHLIENDLWQQKIKRSKLQRKSTYGYKSGIIIIIFNDEKIDFGVKFVFLQSPI
jgi:hypothetical protein